MQNGHKSGVPQSTPHLGNGDVLLGLISERKRNKEHVNRAVNEISRQISENNWLRKRKISRNMWEGPRFRSFGTEANIIDSVCMYTEIHISCIIDSDAFIIAYTRWSNNAKPQKMYREKQSMICWSWGTSVDTSLRLMFLDDPVRPNTLIGRNDPGKQLMVGIHLLNNSKWVT